MKKLFLAFLVLSLSACAPLAPMPKQPAKNYTGGDYFVYPLCCTPEKGGDSAS